jgi:hypothetical protein
MEILTQELETTEMKILTSKNGGLTPLWRSLDLQRNWSFSRSEIRSLVKPPRIRAMISIHQLPKGQRHCDTRIDAGQTQDGCRSNP